MPREKQNSDAELHFKRMAHYREKHSGYAVFKGIYWAIYLLAIGIFLLMVPASVSVVQIVGFAAVLLAMFYAIFGLVISLHYKLMKKIS